MSKVCRGLVSNTHHPACETNALTECATDPAESLAPTADNNVQKLNEIKRNIQIFPRTDKLFFLLSMIYEHMHVI